MKKWLGIGVMAAMVLLVWGADAATTTTKKKAPVKKGTAASTAKKGTSKKAPAKKGAVTATSRKKGPASKKPATTWRNRQLAPTPDRYREIQGALVAKGYLDSSDANGAWNQNSMD